MPDERGRIQALVNDRIGAKIPTAAAWSSTVAIVMATPPSIAVLGSGSLFEIAGEYFVITAAHVVGAACQHQKTIAISSDGTSLTAADGQWMASVARSSGAEDPFDVAAYRLPERAVQRLGTKRFLRREDVDWGEQSSTAVFALFGFPGLWSAPSTGDGEPVRSKALEYVTYAVADGTSQFVGFDARYHLLLDATPKQTTTPDGARVTLRRRNGQFASFPLDLGGISGCPVWLIGDLEAPMEEWGPPRLVGVQTHVYRERAAIRASRWVAVSTLLAGAYPALRSALDLWTPPA